MPPASAMPATLLVSGASKRRTGARPSGTTARLRRPAMPELMESPPGRGEGADLNLGRECRRHVPLPPGSRPSAPQPRNRRVKEYPHQFAGGMRQRAMIALALACNPAVLIADEPTTALDVTIQAQIMELLDRLRRDTGTAIVLITHISQRGAVMYLGRIVEIGTVERPYSNPSHPYTQALLSAVPKVKTGSQARLDRAQRGHPQPGKPALRMHLPNALPGGTTGLFRNVRPHSNPTVTTTASPAISRGHEGRAMPRGRCSDAAQLAVVDRPPRTGTPEAVA